MARWRTHALVEVLTILRTWRAYPGHLTQRRELNRALRSIVTSKTEGQQTPRLAR